MKRQKRRTLIPSLTRVLAAEEKERHPAAASTTGMGAQNKVRSDATRFFNSANDQVKKLAVALSIAPDCSSCNTGGRCI